MTYTILGHCPRTGELGVGIATYSVAVGGLCPAAKCHVGAVTSQAFVNPEIKSLGLALLDQGYSAVHALAILKQGDAHLDYRQIGLIDREGRTAVHTGANNRGWAGHKAGRGYVALGNVLAGEAVVAAMAAAFEASDGQSLSHRLLLAIEAGRDAGGQVGSRGHLPERSASLLVRGNSDLDGVDLRVDMHPHAVEDLRRIHDAFRPYAAFNRQRWLEPAAAPAQEAFVASLPS